MGDQRERNRIKSRVDELPDEIRAQLDAMLADVNYTYQDIADTITDLGYEISRSAVGRYAMRHNSGPDPGRGTSSGRWRHCGAGRGRRRHEQKPEGRRALIRRRVRDRGT